MSIDQLLASDLLPYVFAFLMGLSMLIYAVLDGYDLGVGMLTLGQSDGHKDKMIASIGPFWDANETWLVLGVGLLLVAFPMAQGVVLGALYLPVAVMLFGLIFRGVAFDFRAKVAPEKKLFWDRAFFAGSLLTTLAQGYMVGSYVMGFKATWQVFAFSCFTAVALVAAYCLVGACWLVWRTEGSLQQKAVSWAQHTLGMSCAGIVTVSVATPMVSPRIFEKWFSMPEFLMLAPLPALTAVLVIALFFLLEKMPLKGDRYCWAPLVTTIGVYVLCFAGLAYSFFPYIVPDQITIVEAASAPESLLIMLVGALIVLPILIGYTAVAYYVFRGKVQGLRYD